MSLYYVSESNILSSNFLREGEGSWVPDGYFGNYSTAVETRSLSISLFPTANTSSNFNLDEISTTNAALLFYEKPNGKISALLHRLMNIDFGPQGGESQQDQWIDITSQESEGLPNEFRNAPGFNYRNSLYKYFPYNTTFSKTLYEADPLAVYNTPFFSAPNLFGSGAIFYSPFNLQLNTTSTLAESFFTINYGVGLNGTGNFSLVGMNDAYSCTEWFREITFILASTLPSKDYTSIHQSDIAGFGSNDGNGIWVNGTQPALIQPENTESASLLPSNHFPFKRLASVSLADGSATYLYHQINGTTFAEEEWDNSFQGWVNTEYITVSDS